MSQSRDEIDPYLVAQVADGTLRCGLWALEDGQRALALFLTPDSAERYRQAAGLDETWEIRRPSREEIVRLLRHTLEAGIPYAVLDPDGQSAKRLFDLEQVLRSLDEAD